MAELLILEAQVTDCRSRVATTNDGECVRVDDSLCHRAGTLSEGSNLEHANGAVPEDGLCSLNLLSEDFAGLGANVQTLSLCTQLAAGQVLNGANLGVSVSGECIRPNNVNCGNDLGTLLGSFLQVAQNVLNLVLLQQRLANLVALCVCEGVAHTATNKDGVSLTDQVVNHGELIGNLSATHDHNEGTLGVVQGLSQNVNFLLHQVTQVCGQTLSNVVDGSVLAVNRTECVVHVCAVLAGQCDQLVSELATLCVILGGFACVVADVLNDQNFAVSQGCCLSLCVLAYQVGCNLHGHGCQLSQACSCRCDGVLGVNLALGAAQVRGHDNACASLGKLLNDGQGCADAAVVGDNAVLQGYVQVGTNENVAACDAFFEQFGQCLSHRISSWIGGFIYRFHHTEH